MKCESRLGGASELLAIPTPITDPQNMADWLEFRALAADDGNASANDLRRALVAAGGDAGVPSRTGNFTGTAHDEIFAGDTLAELDNRARSSPEAYPFRLDGSLLTVKPEWSHDWPYLFCLLLSLKGANRDELPPQPTSLFEEVAEVAARAYVSGRSAKFGFPRRTLPANFVEALDKLCDSIGEGRGGKRRPESVDAKDARLDIVAWRPFPDKRPAQLILFGQCAAGANWKDKLTDLQPSCFMDLYLNEHFKVLPVRAFFTPFRLADDGWDRHSTYGGILFDRCRISHLAHGQTAPPGVADWTTRAIRDLKR